MQAIDTELWSRLASMYSQIYSHLFAPIWAPIWVILKEEKVATVKSACSKLFWLHLVVESRKQSALGQVEGAVRGSALPNTFVRSGNFGVWLSGGKWGCPVGGCTAKESFRVAPALTVPSWSLHASCQLPYILPRVVQLTSQSYFKIPLLQNTCELA